MSISPYQKTGTDRPKTEPRVRARSSQLLRQRDEAIPAGTPPAMAIRSDAPERRSVAGRLRPISSWAGRPSAGELPRFPCSTLANHLTYWTCTG